MCFVEKAEHIKNKLREFAIYFFISPPAYKWFNEIMGLWIRTQIQKGVAAAKKVISQCV